MLTFKHFNERYSGEWEIHLKDGQTLSDCEDKRVTRSGYFLNVDDKEYATSEGIRGMNFPFDMSVRDGKIFIKYT